ncbi:BON domain-containing protein [Methylotuvimicrobium alcaliphilum]|uniref:Transport-associated protein n=1 Tax=Methylotuvimicrobium alcaliphilum (strain DSM 19304 / NCIMB 14124 / VKM B-2133 / 20Z) TaxID=1091494 RepID=G4SX89_META2|nr:BON domain-containing protein [Methylotuvimicrobium alcaliphilum]CCE24245.1 Transport-associated protein [Methylotuvimicrobium alcaliphilum 20Z]
MSTRLPLVLFTLTGSLILMTGTVQAEQDSVIYLAADSSSKMDNTERNVRDRDDANLTPEDQKESKGDIDITATIRQAVVRDESLSLNAKNAKIITRHGVVTLRGLVESEAERLTLQQIATQTPGVVQIDNQLEIKAP